MSIESIGADFDLNEWIQSDEAAKSQCESEEKIIQMLFSYSPESRDFKQMVAQLAWIGSEPQLRALLEREIAELDLSELPLTQQCGEKWDAFCQSCSKVGRFFKKHRKEILVGAVICATGVGLAAVTGYGLSVSAGGIVVVGVKSIFASQQEEAKQAPLPDPQACSKQEAQLYGQSINSSAPALDLPPSPNQLWVTADGIWSNGQFYSTSQLSNQSNLPRATSSGTTWQTLASFNLAQQISDGSYDAVTYRYRAQNALALGNYAQAAHDYGKAIEADPLNSIVYVERAAALFNLENYDASLQDYHQVASEPQPLSVSEFSLGFAKGLPRGVYESGEGMILFFADFVKHPIQTSKQMIESINTLVQLARTDEWGVIGEALSPEIHQLVTQWDFLSSQERGELAGYAIGKIGSDILLPGSLPKVAAKSVKSAEELVAICKNIKIAQETLVLEAATEIGSSIKIAEVVQMSKKTTQLAEECGISASEMGQLKQAGKLESTVATGAERFAENPALRESYLLHKRAQDALEPFVKKPLPEQQVRELIHSTGIPTFPRPEGIPEDFLVMISEKGGGMTYMHPNDTHTTIRVMPGKLHSPHPYQQKPYIIQKKNSNTLDKLGNIVDSAAPEAHIPLEEFMFRD